MDKSDHDLLIEIHTDQKNYMKLMADHFQEDDENFKALRGDIRNIERWKWQVVGGITFLVFLIELGAKVWAKQ